MFKTIKYIYIRDAIIYHKPTKKLFLTGLPAQMAADVEGLDSPGGGPGEAGSIFLKLGLTLFLIHVATLEL